MDDRQLHIQDQINLVWENEEDEWKKEYYRHAANFLSQVEVFEGGQVCGYCRTHGLTNPHHHNVWGAMVSSLAKLGWATKIGSVEPTTRHTHINSVGKWKSNLFKGGALHE